MAARFPTGTSWIKKNLRLPLFIGLDFDGTLAPIVKHPDQARMPLTVRRDIFKLAAKKNIQVAIISGRSLEQLQQLAKIGDTWAAGNHGLEIKAGMYQWRHPQAKKFRKFLPRIEKDLSVIARKYPGALVENKGLMIALHYRQVSISKVEPLHAEFSLLCRKWKKKAPVQIGRGKKVLEIRPAASAHKGHAIAKLASKFFAGRSGTILYFGDDRTDEDAFEYLGNSAISVYVGTGRLTAARYYLSSPTALYRVLRKFATVL